MSFEDTTFDMAPDVAGLGIKGIYLIISGVQNKDTDPEFTAYQQASIERILSGLSTETIQHDPYLEGYRNLHTSVGFSNRNFPAAPETLLENLLKYGRQTHINLLVDIYNLISLETHMALGAHDLAFITGNIHLKPMTGTEGFWPLGSSEAKKSRPGGYSYIDDANDILCMLDSRQVEKTKVTPDTVDCFYVIQGNASITDQALAECAEKLIRLTQKYCGGEFRFLYPRATFYAKALTTQEFSCLSR